MEACYQWMIDNKVDLRMLPGVDEAGNLTINVCFAWRRDGKLQAAELKFASPEDVWLDHAVRMAHRCYLRGLIDSSPGNADAAVPEVPDQPQGGAGLPIPTSIPDVAPEAAAAPLEA